jgi:hypothetical protein
MRLSQKIDLRLSQLFKVEDSYPGAGRDFLLSIPVTFGACVLLAYSAESQASTRLKYAAAVSLAMVGIGLLLAASRALIVCVAAAFIGLRGIIALALSGYVEGLLLILVAIFAILLVRGWLPNGKGS